MSAIFEIRVCENSACRLRYPSTKGNSFGERCPNCLGPTKSVLSYSTLSESNHSPDSPHFIMGALLDNIRSAWNVGAIFRTSDGLGINKLYLCGITPTPENISLKKTSLGSEESVQWLYDRNALDMANKLVMQGIHLWALEQDERSVSIYSKFSLPLEPVVLIVGNEVSGVDPDLLNLCEKIIHIPMLGKKRSLNVEVAFSAAVAVLQTK